MARVDTIKLTDGTTEISLVLDTNAFNMLADGMEFGIPEHDNIYHESDFRDGAMVVRERVKNRYWPMKIAVRGGTDDALANTLIGLNRLAKQARRWQRDYFGDKVYLHFELDGSTVPTFYDVIDIKYSSVDVMNYYNRQAQEITFGDGLSITIETAPYGYGAAETLRNELVGPFFQEDGDSDGFGDGWSAIDSPATIADAEPKITGGLALFEYAGLPPEAQVVAIAQRFAVKADGNINKVTINLKKSGSPTFDLYATIHSNDSGGVDDAPGVLIGDSSDVLSAATLTTSYTTATFTWSGPPVAVTESTLYWLAINGIATGTTDIVYVGTGSDTDGMYMSEAISGLWVTSVSEGIPQDGTSQQAYFTVEYTGEQPQISSSTKIVGLNSQKIITNSSGNNGIDSDAISTSSDGDDFVAYAWVYRLAGDEITASVIGSTSGEIDSAAYSAATTTTVVSGNTWRRLELSGTAAASETLTLRIAREAGDATQITTFYVDKCYLQLGVDTIPMAWSSCKTTHNHYDSDAGHINYIVVSDVPGDVDSKLRLVTDSLRRYSRIYVSRKSFASPTDLQYYIPRYGGNELYVDSSGSVDPTASGNACAQVSVTGSAYADLSVSSPYDKYQYGKYVVFARLQAASDVSVYARVGIKSNSLSSTLYSQPKTVTLGSNYWKWINFGIVDIKEQSVYGDAFFDAHAVLVTPQMKRTATGTTAVYVDFTQLIPCDEFYSIADALGIIPYGGLVESIVGNLERDYESSVYDIPGSLGVDAEMFTLGNVGGIVPGKDNLITLAYTNESTLFSVTPDHFHPLHEHGLGGDFYTDTSIVYRPQTEFFLGTI